MVEKGGSDFTDTFAVELYTYFIHVLLIPLVMIFNKRMDNENISFFTTCQNKRSSRF